MRMRAVVLAAMVVACEPRERPSAAGTSGSEGESAARPVVPTSADELASAEIPSPCGDGTRVALSGGAGHYPSTIGLDAPGDIELRPLATTDLDGDGTPELLAYLLCMPGGSGTFDSVRAYHVIDGRVVELAAIEGGDRADGGLSTARVLNDTVLVARNVLDDDDALCCPTRARDETWRLSDGHFVRVDVGPTHPI